jgi:hypothetical protein
MYLSVFQSRSRSHRLSYHVALKFHKGFDGVNKMHVLHQEIARHARFVQVPTTKSFLNTTLNPQTPAEIQSVDLPTIRNTEIDISSPNPQKGVIPASPSCQAQRHLQLSVRFIAAMMLRSIRDVLMNSPRTSRDN